MSSPARKRMRLSSPTYDNHLDELDDDCLQELDRIETTLSQLAASSSSQGKPQMSQRLDEDARQRRMRAIMSGLQEEYTNEEADAGGKRAREERPAAGFKFAGALSTQQTRANVKYDHYEPSSSPEEAPPEPDYSKWFEVAPDSSTPLIGFQRVSKSLLAAAAGDDVVEPLGFASANKSIAGAGFASASAAPGAVLEPSKAALELAAKKLKVWSEEDESVEEVADVTQTPSKAGPSFVRPVFASVANTPSFRPPISPKPNSANRSVSSPSLDRPIADKARVFKSPLIGRPSPRTVYPRGSGDATASSNQNSPSVSRSTRPHPLSSTPLTCSPERQARIVPESALPFTTPVRATNAGGPESAKRAYKGGFATPFKAGMKPGEPGRAALERAQKARKVEEAKRAQVQTQKVQTKQNNSEQMNRVSLQNSGLVPQRYSADELESMGINITELSQISPQTAPFYFFYTDASHAPTQTQFAPTSFGPAEAHAHLQQTGRALASREWVDNHWALVLWKLAALACLEPEREATHARRWCWGSVLAQLEARYDKEIGRGARPALRLIAAQDAPPGAPLVLVVSQVVSAEPERIGSNGRVVEEASAELEVSDGWYRLRAVLDPPLVRAVLRGVVKVGCKIAIAGAKLDNDRKDASEILQAYDSCALLLGGNGTHLAPWHAKLGFQPQPFVATLASLTPDGGPVPLIDLIVEKVYPIAYFEYTTGPGGKRIQDGPLSEAEEAEINNKWMKRRDVEEAKVQDELNARWGRWEGFADRLERAVAGRFTPAEDEMPPDHIDDLFDELDELPPNEITSFIRGLGPDECAWLARFLRRKSARDKELAVDEMELEMKHRCAPRDVRNFRVVVVRDARVSRRPANRLAQLTIWDVLGLCVSEGGKAGAIEIGQRFLMTNLGPTQQRAWMGLEKDDTGISGVTQELAVHSSKMKDGGKEAGTYAS
ncbi:hypothetical protein DFH11DRAFT_1802190 [Phellopilus nigrolimitatus]|nr:hypothetical protein DFH11DRAFT_1802190 [Phellopilus nigrolimitatus]